MNWGYYMQGYKSRELDKIGSQLSIQLNCPVHYPAYEKRLFECKCGITFPYFAVENAVESGDWAQIMNRHNGVE